MWKWVALGGIPVVIVVYRMIRPWLERNGWVFPRGEAGSAGSAFLHMQALIDPSKQHVIEWQISEEARRMDAESTGPGDIKKGAMLSQSEQDRRIDYIEFPAPDVAAAKRFYSAVFGWEFTDYGPDYTSFADGRLAGGFTTEGVVAVGGPLVVLYATDLEAIKHSIAAHGGAIRKDTFEFPGGRRFHFRDPNGNELAVWTDR